MATLALAAVGAAVGSTLLPTGFTLLGATLSGATIGAQIGALAGSYVDSALFGASGGSQTVKGPRLADLHVTASTEGAPIPRVYGRARLGGQIIWADEIEEVASTQSAGGSGKGLGGGGGGKTTTYSYYASFAVAIAEGRVNSVGRIWADGKELDLDSFVHRFHHGSEDQLPDDLLSQRLGADSAPAFRGLAYIVFERMALADFGNRLPQLSFEVFRDVDDFASDVRAVVMIPGSGEFVYATEPVSRGLGGGTSQSENVHTRLGGSDWSVSLDQLSTTLPGVTNVSLVTSWFGTDLRAGVCQLRPGVDSAAKVTTPGTWKVAGVERAAAYVVSTNDDRPAYGGTPSDTTVIAAIGDLKARGYGVTLTPFILMDVPAGNSLLDPYTGATSQPAYPWRGRMTCHPAPAAIGTVDKTAAAANQISALVGTANASHFALSGSEVTYSGPAEWSFRRMVLHYAHLAKAAGGVDAFVIGTELRGLTQVRSSSSAYPFVAALVALAADVKSVLGPATTVTYAADWSEYFGHQPADGTGDVHFNLDPLWASPAIDAIGIDLYWPLSDWRDGRSHLDYIAGTRSIYDLEYLSSNVAAGEGYDWYYASSADRDAQVRSPITDGAGKPWVFRYKDLTSWWSEPHFDRPSGTEAAASTAWIPKSKPVWLMEIGCPAVDKGANQPNVFVDPKSVENALPHYSRALRDDFMQRQYLKALIRAFDPTSMNYASGTNPVSPLYGGRMVTLDRIHVYAWDARPYPAFPNNLEAWGDGANWRLGHWLNGRVASAPLDALVKQMLVDYDFADFDSASLSGSVPGYVVDHVMSARDALQPLSLAFFFDAVESAGAIDFRHRAAEASVASLASESLVELRKDASLLTLTRGQETELPATAKITYISASDDYRQAVAESRRLACKSTRVSEAQLPIVLDDEQAGRIADSWLHEAWVSRDRASFAVPASHLAIEPGDTVTIAIAGEQRQVRVTEISDRGVREIEARAVDAAIYDAGPVSSRPTTGGSDVLSGTPLLYFLDLPLLRGDEAPEAAYVAARQQPWPGGVSVYRSPESSGFNLNAVVATPATLGLTLNELASGPQGRIDRAASLEVALGGGALASVTRLQMLSGQNAAAVRNASGDWEVLQFEHAELTAPSVYTLSGLLRGQAGTEVAMNNPISAGAPFVLLDAALTVVPMTLDEIGLPFMWRYGPAGRDIGDITYASATHAFRGAGLEPYAPGHVRGVRTASGPADVTFSWVRRTRIGGDSWEVADVPLGEVTEAYEIEILDGSTVKRVLGTSIPSVTYSEAQQIADFGVVQPSYSVRVYQMSAVSGRGAPRDAVA